VSTEKSIYTNDSRNVGIDYSDPDGVIHDHSMRSRRSSEPHIENLMTNRRGCTVHKKYIPSPYELYHIELAKKIDAITDFEQRLSTLLSHVTSEISIKNATLWLNRVNYHMNNIETVESNIDYQFLSRFEVQKVCGQDSKFEEVTVWNEWIEPITITARHPFGFGNCRNTQTHFTKGIPRANRANVNYVLLQSGKALHNYTTGNSMRNRPMHMNRRVDHQNRKEKHFMLDAGTSTFDSSLFWFTCGYSQRKIAFDQVYAWEKTLLEPTDYWSRVPPKWKPFWHFYNVPISSDPLHPDSPLRFIEAIATPHDFVSFKLDIDHPDTEMPIALALLNNPKYTNLIDEFFFELHFQCEVMTSCGWGKQVPATSHGLKLDRSHILDFFYSLRAKGIRAHIWP
jgi:hypothetical protein